jgi:hypothetical protein
MRTTNQPLKNSALWLFLTTGHWCLSSRNQQSSTPISSSSTLQEVRTSQINKLSKTLSAATHSEDMPRHSNSQAPAQWLNCGCGSNPFAHALRNPVCQGQVLKQGICCAIGCNSSMFFTCPVVWVRIKWAFTGRPNRSSADSWCSLSHPSLLCYQHTESCLYVGQGKDWGRWFCHQKFCQRALHRDHWTDLAQS